MSAITEPCPQGGTHSIAQDDWDDRLYCWKCGAWWDVTVLPSEVLADLPRLRDGDE